MIHRRRFLILTVGVFLLIALFYALVDNPLDPFDRRHFSPAAWQTATAQERARMARSAIRHDLPAGLSEPQVIALLGKPDGVCTIEDGGGHKLPGAQTYSYDLGSWSTYGYDDAFLYVHLDTAGHVLSAEINGY